MKRIFPRLFGVSMQKSCSILQMGSWHDNIWSWNLRWRRALYEWELEDVARLENILVAIAPRQGCTDGVSSYGLSPASFPIKSIVAKVYEDFRPILSKNTINIIWLNQTPLEHS